MAFKAIASLTQGITNWYHDRNYDQYIRNLSDALTSRDRLTVDSYIEYFKSKNLLREALREYGGAFATTFFPPSIFSSTDAFKGADYTLMLLVLETRTITPDEALASYPSSFELAIGEEDFQALLACIEFEATDTTRWYNDKNLRRDRIRTLEYGSKSAGKPESERLRARVNRAAIDLRRAKALRNEIKSITESNSFQEVFNLACKGIEVFNIYSQYQKVAYEDAYTSDNPTRFAVGNFFADIALKYASYAYQLLKNLYSKYDTLTLTDADKAAYTHALVLLIQLAPLVGEEASIVSDYCTQFTLRTHPFAVEALKRNSFYDNPKAHGGAGVSHKISPSIDDAAIAKRYPQQYVAPMSVFEKIDLPTASAPTAESRASAGAVAVSFAAHAGAGVASAPPHHETISTLTNTATSDEGEDPNATDTDDSAESVRSDTAPSHNDAEAMTFNPIALSKQGIRHRAVDTSFTPAS